MTKTEIEVPPMSASSLKTFEGCPGQFEFGTIKGVEGTDTENKYTIVGSMIHDAIEEVIRNTDDAGELGENELAHLMKSNFHANPEKEKIDQKMVNRGMKALQVAARFVSDFGDIEFTSTEERFETYINGVHFRGYMDATTRHEVWDWKSGNMPDDDDRLGEILQGMVYWEGFREMFDRPPERIRFIYLKEGKERVYDEKGNAYQEMMDMIEKVRRAIKENSFEYKPGSHCTWCPHELRCPASKVGIGGQSWEKFNGYY
jgi:putative RecB family exonuclease